MTFLLRRKRRTTRPAAPDRLARRITSALFVWSLFLSSVQAQTTNTEVITPRFVPAQQRTMSRVVPAAYKQGPGKPGNDAQPRPVEEGEESYVHPEFPGPQRLFMRDSETQFFDRIRHEMKKQKGRAIFPEEP